MKFEDIFEETYTALSANKIRSGLTMLGIVIGIASVIAMVSIGAGAKNSIESNIQSLGSNLIQVMPGAQRGPGSFGVSGGRGSSRTLTEEDAEAIEENVAGIAFVSPEQSGRYQITAKGTNTNTSVYGVTRNYAEVRKIEVAEGIFITDSHNASSAKVAVIGPTVRDDLFGEGGVALGQAIRINKIEFKIIGVTATKGGSGFQNQDDMIFIPLSSSFRYLAGNKFLTTIAIEAEEADGMADVEASVTDLLLTRHKISDATLADFYVMNQSDLISTASDITETFTMLLASIAGISLLVGGIGIMNMMLTTVTERTREIGLRKAIGAASEDISLQFLAEAVTITLLGGIAGVVIGFLIAFVLKKFDIIATSVSLGSVLLAFGVSAFIGVLFGWYPARKASKLNPIEALRYE